MKQEIVEKILSQYAENQDMKRFYTTIYKSMSLYEEEVGRGIESFNASDIIEFFNAQKYSDIASVKNNLLYIKQYCRADGLKEDIQQIQANEIDLSLGMSEQLFKSLSDIYNMAFLEYSPDNGDAIFPLVSFAWMGLPFSQAVKVKKIDVDLEKGVIQNNGKLLFEIMPKEMCDILLRYVSVTSVKRANRKTEFPDGRPEFIYKTVPAGSSRAFTPITTPTVSSWYEKINTKYQSLYTNKKRLSTSNVLRSAKFYKLWQMELSGVDWKDKKNSSILQEAYGTSRIEPSDIRHNYFMYKKAFGLK